MVNELVKEVKKKREFSQIPDSIVAKILETDKDVKLARASLRKYFGVFLTNKVLKGKTEKVLESHISSKLRDYREFYKRIFQGKKFNSVIDLGSGANGFSYNFLKEELGDFEYFGVEASGQIVDNTNEYFKSQKIMRARVECLDLFEKKAVFDLINMVEEPRAILMLQVVDALESLERNFSKEFLVKMQENLTMEDLIVISMPLNSISGKKKFEARRTWISTFLEENFIIKDDFNLENERIFLVRKK